MDKSMVKVAIEMFLGEFVLDLVESEDYIHFQTIAGTLGEVVSDPYGNMSIMVGDEIIYEIESDLRPILSHNENINLLGLYEYIKSIDIDMLKYKSKMFLDIVRASVEKIILAGTIKMEGRAVIGPFEVIYTNRRKIFLWLN